MRPMSDQASSNPPEPMQFDVAEPAAATTSSSSACANCKLPLSTEYYETSGQMVCPACRNNITARI